jgi:hypothetical protein
MAFLGGGADRGQEGGQRDVGRLRLEHVTTDHVGPALAGEVGVFGGEVGQDPADILVHLGVGESGVDVGRGGEVAPEAAGDPDAVVGEQGRDLPAIALEASVRIEQRDPLRHAHLGIFPAHRQRLLSARAFTGPGSGRKGLTSRYPFASEAARIAASPLTSATSMPLSRAAKGVGRSGLGGRPAPCQTNCFDVWAGRDG